MSIEAIFSSATPLCEGAKAPSPSRISLMGVDQSRHAFEAVIVFGRPRRRHGRTPTTGGMAAIDPDRCQAQLIARRVIVKQALRNVQDVGLVDPKVCLQVAQHIFEVPQIRLVRPDILSRIYRVECNLKSSVARSKRSPVHIGKNHQLVMLFEILQSLDRIWKLRPIRD